MNSAELRERLEVLPETRTVENQSREDVILTRAQFAQLVRERSEAAAALERLGELEEALRCEKCGGDDISTRYRAPGETLDGGIGTARSYFDRVEVECLRRCCRRCGFRWTDATLATPAPAPQQGGTDD